MKGKIKEISTFLKTLTFKKIWNYIKLLFSYFLSVIIKKPIQLALPANMAIEPTTKCNLSCLECLCGQQKLNRAHGSIDGKVYRKIIDNTYRKLLTLTLYFQGEPFLHKFLFKMVEYAKEKNIYTITSTNGHFLDEANAKRVILSGLDRIIISLDGITPNAYNYYRIGGSFEKVIEGIETLVKQKKMMNSSTPYILLQFLVHKENEHQVEEAKKYARKIGVDEICFKSLQLVDNKNNHDLLPSEKKFSRYKKNKKGKYRIKSNLPNRCFRMWQSFVVTWEGKVVPCCFDKNAENIMGDLNQQSLKEIYTNKKYKNFRKKIFAARKTIDMCQNCTEGLKVKI